MLFLRFWMIELRLYFRIHSNRYDMLTVLEGFFCSSHQTVYQRVWSELLRTLAMNAMWCYL